jgi:phage recombination protein Bet
MNVLAMPTDGAARAMVAGNRTSGWWNDKGLIKLARRTAFKDTNDEEFDQAVAFCREKSLSPMSGQLFAFVFSKDDPKKRNMVIVTSIMGYRAIANRSGDYMPGPARAYFDPGAKDSLINPRGLVRATGAADRFIHGGWKSVEEEALWESFAPILKSGADEDYEWVDTGETWADTGKPKKRRRLRQGAEAQPILDPKKDGWHRMPDVMLKKCAEAAALRRGWPEDLSGLYVEEEIHRSQVIDGDYTDLTPSEIVAKIDTEQRLDRIGGPALFATFDDCGTLVRVPHGQFADRMLEATEKMGPNEVAILVDRNREALREFWAHNANDALELRKILEQRSGAVAVRAAGDEGTRATAAPPQHGETDMGGAAQPANTVPGALTGREAFQLKSRLLTDLRQLTTVNDFLSWARSARVHINRLPADMQQEIDTEFQRCQGHIQGNN